MSRDLRTREGRMAAINDSVSCPECTLPARARLVVVTIALVAHRGEPLTARTLARYANMSRPTVQKYLDVVAGACGSDPVEFVSDVVEHRRSVTDWIQALERHGGRHGA